MKESKKNIIVAMSGGVDSSLAAWLCREQGYNVIGVFMKLNKHYHHSEAAARQVAKKIGIKFYAMNLSQQFKQEVINYFINSYENGLTPNPCVKCNKAIKFGLLMNFMQQLNCDYLATGHYLKKVFNAKKKIYKIYKSQDTEKDQSYFLYNLSQAQLRHILFPLGKYTKKTVKEMAEKYELPNLAQESQDVCFLYENEKNIDHNKFLQKYIKTKSGPIMTLDREIIGQHKGLPFYTIGQRKGVEIGGTGPYYVVKLDYKKNILYVSNNHNDPELLRDKLIAKNINWVSGNTPAFPFDCEAVIRYRHKAEKCKVYNENNNIYVKFAKPQRAITPGQSVVFYNKNELLGGGIIYS